MRRRREPRSLFGEILDWMLVPLLLLWPMSAALTWLVAQDIAAKPYDRDLTRLTQLIARQLATGADGSLRLAESTASLLRADEAGLVWVQVLDDKGQLLSGDREVPLPPPPAAARIGEVLLRDATIHNQPVRVAALQPLASEAGVAWIQVAQSRDKRDRLTTEIIKGVLLPQYVILPLAVLLVWLALARGIAPLTQLQTRIAARDSHDLSPIDVRGTPEEVVPLVEAINGLLARLDQSLAAQKHFLADAAHQLKTPLAGLRTQAELAERDIDAGNHLDSVRHGLRQIAHSSQRAAHMVNQLLAMAHAENDGQLPAQRSAIDLAALARDVVQHSVQQAMDKRIDLGYEGPEPGDAPLPPLECQPVLLRELVRNLVDNALHYTPHGGRVTVRVTPDPFGQVLVLQVEDDGPGIAPAERDKVFAPFYRALGTAVDGSGLGLAIVREIADGHGATVTLAATRNDPQRPGLAVTVRLPLRAGAPPPPSRWP